MIYPAMRSTKVNKKKKPNVPIYMYLSSFEDMNHCVSECQQIEDHDQCNGQNK